MKLARLTGLERGKINDEMDTLAVEIKDHLETLGDKVKLYNILKTELLAIKEQFATPRQTIIEDSEFEQDIEDLIAREDMVVSVTQRGYIKRVPLATYRAQKRGGKGRAGVAMRDDEDVTRKVFVTNTHTPVLFFSSTGKVYKSKVYQLPVGTPTSTGKALINIFPLQEGESITNVMAMPEDIEQWNSMNIVFATTTGNIRRNDLSDFKDVRSNGKIAIKLEEAGERLVGVRTCNPDDHILLASRMGNAVRFPVDTVRVFKSRSSTGVRGMKLKEKDDYLVSISILKGGKEESEIRDKFLSIPIETRQAIALDPAAADGVVSELPKDKIISMAQDEEFILTVTENGYGKRSSAYEYRVTNRGGSGIVNIITSERNGNVVGSFPINEKDELILVTDKGKLIRTPIIDVRIAGRNTQGVTILKTASEEHVVTASRIQGIEGEEAVEGEAAEETPTE